MKNYTLLASLAILLLVTACSNEPKPLETIVKGKITVADSLDDSGDYSDIGIAIIKQDSVNAPIDTLFYTQTDVDGNFTGTVNFPAKNYYTLVLSRNNYDLSNLRVILADNDTLTVNAELPDVAESLVLESREHEAMRTLNRVERSFQRVGAYARSGAIPDSQIVDEIEKWSDLYWQVYEAHENTIASYLAAEKAAELLSSLDPEEMLDKIDTALPEDYMISVALNLGKPYIAESKGFEAASNYLDSLAEISTNESAREFVQRNKIQMYFDSSRVRQAKELLDKYEKNYTGPASKKWARTIRYDLNYLAPGVSAPEFSFITMDGDTVNNSRLEGTTYILEISPVANYEYQNDYDRTLIINEIYKNYGLEIFTIPLDQSEVTVNAFFEERRKAWSVAKIGTFDVQQVIQKFNVIQVPTRLLIDKNGVLIRKYERGEFDDVIQGLNQAFREVNAPS
ncbi:MAG TPA: hypothetical protein VFM80_07425 [Gracilimonas sp.]|uniref:peroxiredoxin family protein n=1 Tax=Gracilimonas sp. TaxID=1974203 RepID=UPI002D8434B3|nr:hypothetical protein [Gracilimonas sp.]